MLFLLSHGSKRDFLLKLGDYGAPGIGPLIFPLLRLNDDKGLKSVWQNDRHFVTGPRNKLPDRVRGETTQSAQPV